ncbi:MAG: AMP-binding protein [Rhodobiaceae bacterium]|nr:AMP-binding protein [Rhodobiaceae bacterium]MCC0040571.1 AMP-binding protein [Rhodobiaceae bacterium]
MDMTRWLVRAAGTCPDSPAIAHGASVFQDYRTLAERAARLAAGMAAAGLKPGDRVLVAAANCPQYLEMLYGIWWAGCAPVPANAKLHGAELAYMISHSGARLCLADAKIADAVAAEAPEGLERLVVVGSAGYEALFAGDAAEPHLAGPDEMAWLFYTSGTTGKPKGAMLSHRNLLAMTLAYLTDVDPTAPGDRILHAAPLSHGSGLYAMAHVARFGVNIVPESGGFEPDEIAKLTRHWKNTSMFAAPTMIKRMVASAADHDPGGFRTVIWGGAPMYVADIKQALERFGPVFAQIYGQGETPMTTTLLPRHIVADNTHPRWEERIGSAGHVNPVVCVRTFDEDDRPLPPGEVGEVVVRGETVMLGYWNNPEATAQAMRSGWLHTGDVGSFDDDGFLTLRDRSKDMIISGGSNIYPREVEEVLLTHPQVREVSVIGRPHGDWGEVVVAYVVGEAGDEDLDALCLSRIARFKRPKHYVYVDELPKNNYGKILKTELRARDAERVRRGQGHGDDEC